MGCQNENPGSGTIEWPSKNSFGGAPPQALICSDCRKNNFCQKSDCGPVRVLKKPKSNWKQVNVEFFDGCGSCVKLQQELDREVDRRMAETKKDYKKDESSEPESTDDQSSCHT